MAKPCTFVATGLPQDCRKNTLHFDCTLNAVGLQIDCILNAVALEIA